MTLKFEVAVVAAECLELEVDDMLWLRRWR